MPLTADSLKDIAGSLPSDVRSKLLGDEHAYYFLQGKSGCLSGLTAGRSGGSSSLYFLLTDSRVILRGEHREGRRVKKVSATEIPLEHVSSLSLDHEKGCLSRQDMIVVRSGTAEQYVPITDAAMAQEAINTVQLLLRERRTQR
jgi:hypothetical protein